VSLLKEYHGHSKKMPRLLSLFDGTGSISTRFLEGGWEVTSLDINESCGASITEDILKWDYLSETPFHVLFAACPCEAYSQANTRGTRNLVLADSLVKRTWDVIQHFQHLNPEVLFFIENPDSSWLWKRKVSESFPHYVRLDFCQYGKPYRKRTRFATNAKDYAQVLRGPPRWQARQICPTRAIPVSRCPAARRRLHAPRTTFIPACAGFGDISVLSAKAVVLGLE
jgi:hypothetical protein